MSAPLFLHNLQAASWRCTLNCQNHTLNFYGSCKKPHVEPFPFSEEISGLPPDPGAPFSHYLRQRSRRGTVIPGIFLFLCLFVCLCVLADVKKLLTDLNQIMWKDRPSACRLDYGTDPDSDLDLGSFSTFPLLTDRAFYSH